MLMCGFTPNAKYLKCLFHNDDIQNARVDETSVTLLAQKTTKNIRKVFHMCHELTKVYNNYSKSLFGCNRKIKPS